MSSISATSLIGNNNSSSCGSTCTKVLCCPVTAPSKIWNGMCSKLGATLRDRIFFQMNNPSNAAQLEEATNYAAQFWDETTPLDGNFPMQEEIRNLFNVIDDHINIRVDNKDLTIRYRLVETKFKGEEAYNFVLFPGNTITMNSNVTAIYPFLTAFLAQQPQGMHGRFITVTQYDMEMADEHGNMQKYKHENLEQGGKIAAEILRALKEKFGDIDQLVAQSIGGILFSVGGDHMDETILPKNVNIHAAPTSLDNVARKFLCGRIFNPFAKCAGYSFDVGAKLKTFTEKMKGKDDFALVISGLKKDHHFPGPANFVMSDDATALQNNGSATLLSYNIPGQVAYPGSQHSLKYNMLQPNYLPKEQAAKFEDREDLANFIVRHSLPK